MQTFLPYPSFVESAKVLDRQRLGKQRIEARQILETNLLVAERKVEEEEGYLASSYSNLCCPDYCIYDGGHSCITFTTPKYVCERFNKTLYNRIPWENHPAVLMWRGYETALCYYGFVICTEWIVRGYKDNQRNYFLETALQLNPNSFIGAYFNDGYLPRQFLPHWLYNKEFHDSHQSKLLWKFPEHYRKFFPEIQENLGYYWPVRKGDIK